MLGRLKSNPPACLISSRTRVAAYADTSAPIRPVRPGRALGYVAHRAAWIARREPAGPPVSGAGQDDAGRIRRSVAGAASLGDVARQPAAARLVAFRRELLADRAYGRYLRLRALPRPEGALRPCAVLVAGLPGTGKSTLAEALAQSLRAPAFSMDWELGTLKPFGVLRPDNTWPMSELMMVSSMARQLQLGSDAIIDGAGFRAEERRRMQAVADALEAAVIGVECVCSDEEAHRGRLGGRSRGIPGWAATVSWEHVKRMRDLWEPWEEPHLVVDSAVETPASALAAVLESVRVSRRQS